MNKKSKRQKQAERIHENIDIFQCPICQNPVQMNDHTTIICKGNHAFDIAKQGYVFLLPKPAQTNYTKKLFEERRNIHVHSPLYETFHKTIAQLIHTYVDTSIPAIRMIDMGTGEGSHMQLIAKHVQKMQETSIVGIGLDIAKEGIIQAAKHDDEHIWLVSDLAHSPIASTSIDIVLNILSPSNHAEFARISKDEGVIIKVIPGNLYLQEVRGFFQSTETSKHSNEAVKSHFSNHLQLVDIVKVHEVHPLSMDERYSLSHMSPLAWDAPEQVVNEFVEHGPSELTIDFEILIGRSHEIH